LSFLPVAAKRGGHTSPPVIYLSQTAGILAELEQLGWQLDDLGMYWYR
jgi:hypothetical protein